MSSCPRRVLLAVLLGACVAGGCRGTATLTLEQAGGSEKAEAEAQAQVLPETGPPPRPATSDPSAQPEVTPTPAVPRGVDVLGRMTTGTPVRFAGSAASALIQHTFAPVGEDRDPDVYFRNPGDRTGLLVFSSTRHSEHADLYLRRTDSGAVVQLTNDGFDNIQPAFSPDGRRIAFASNRSGNWDIFVLDLTDEGSRGLQPPGRKAGLSRADRPSGGGAPQFLQVTDSDEQEVHPTWSPDGGRVAYSCLSLRPGRWEIFVVDVDAGTRRRMLVTEGLFPAWSRTGRLAFQRARNRGEGWFGIWTVTIAGDRVSRAAEVASGADWAAIAPGWSPDGSRLVFATVNRDRLVKSSSSVRYADSTWMVRADGTERIRLTPPGESASAPVWGAGGRVYFVSNRSGRRHIWSLRPVARPTAPAVTRPAVARAAPVAVGG